MNLERQTRDNPIVLFDGYCHLCSGLVRFLLGRDREAQLRFAPLQSEAGKRLLAEYDLPSDDWDSFVLIDTDGAHARSEAALRVTRYLTRPWRWALAFRALPRGLRDALYLAIARSRYSIFGQRDTCLIAPDSYRDRFID